MKDEDSRIMIIIFAVLLLALFLTQKSIKAAFFLGQPDPESNEVSKVMPSELAYSLFKEGRVLFVDTRSASDFKSRTIKGATFVDNYEPNHEIRDVIVLFGYAATLDYVKNTGLHLKRPGGAQFFLLEGGFNRWNEYDLPTEKGVLTH